MLGLAGTTEAPDHDWSPSISYDAPATVIRSARWYQSLTDGNQGNDPDSNPENWTQFTKLKIFNNDEIYIKDFIVQKEGILYKNNLDNNVGKDPAADFINWSNISGIGKQTISMPATSLIKTLSNGAELVEEPIGNLSVNSFSFSQATTNFVQFVIPMPKSWDGLEMEARFYWFADSADTDSVVWQIQAIAVEDGAVLSAVTFPAADAVTDANNGLTVLNISPSKTFTPTGSPENPEMVFFQVFRIPIVGEDDLAADAKLQAIKILYTTISSVDN